MKAGLPEALKGGPKKRRPTLKGIGEAYYVANIFETWNIPTTGQSSDYSSFKDIVWAIATFFLRTLTFWK